MVGSVRSFLPGLDFVYLTPHIIVCKSPTKEAEADALSSFFKLNHAGNHLVIDCSLARNEFVTTSKFDYVERYNGGLAILQIMHFVHRAEAYLSTNPNAVLILMDANGCDKCCTLASTFLMHSGIVMSTEEAITFVNKERSPKDLIALSTPTFKRYITYYESLLRGDQEQFHCNTYHLCRLRIIHGIPNIAKSLLETGCYIYFKVNMLCYDCDDDSPSGSEENEYREVFNELTDVYNGDLSLIPFSDQSSDKLVDIDISKHKLLLRGDCIIDIYSEEFKIMSISFNTSYIMNCYLQYEKNVIDMANEDIKHRAFPEEMKVECFFVNVDDDPLLNLLE